MHLILCFTAFAFAASPGAPAPVPAGSPLAAPSVSIHLRALELPFAANALRAAGMAEADVRAALDEAKAAGLAAADATVLVEETETSVRDHGPVDNFGAFVQARLSEGLRGQDLAEAIRAEHAAHGKGKPEGVGERPPAGEAHGGARSHNSQKSGGEHESEGDGRPYGAGKTTIDPKGEGQSEGAKKGGKPSGSHGGGAAHDDRGNK